MSTRRPAPAGIALAGLALVLAGDVALATEPLPIIVTYEMKRLRESEVVERRDPKAFWVHQIVARLEDKKPAGTIGLKEPATAQVSFSVGRDGAIVSKTIAKSSGIPDVDRETIAMLDRAQPFPPMPAAMGEAVLSFSLPLRFR